jgi:hypothetical protein
MAITVAVACTADRKEGRNKKEHEGRKDGRERNEEG